MVGLVDPAGNRTSWVRDAQSRVIQKNFPDGTAVNYTYENATSRLKVLTDAIGQITNYTYNRDNTVAQVTYINPVNPTPNVSYTYDPVYNRISSMTDGVGSTSYSYYAYSAGGTLGANKVASISGPLANTAVSYTYDSLGRVSASSINGASNSSSTMYDSLGRVTSTSNPLGTFGYEYVDTTNRVSSMQYPNGQVTNYAYYPNSASVPGNDDQRLSQIQNLAAGGGNLSTFNYSYDAAGKLISRVKALGSQSGKGYTAFYDAADQLVGYAPSTGSIVGSSFYAYDALGNRTQSQTDNTITAAKFNSDNQLVSTGAGNSMTFAGSASKPVTITIGGNAATVLASGSWIGTAPASIGANAIPLSATDSASNTVTKTINVLAIAGPTRSLKYDLSGNLLDNGAGQVYQWDAANRLISIVQPSGTTGFIYDGAGRRTQETLNGAVIKQWVWCGSQPCEERDSSGSVTKRFYAQGEQIGGSAYFYSRDHLGSVREMTDSGGAIHAQYDYDPYGNATKVQGDLDADFGFTGDYFHKASGLDLTLYRAYDPATSRWLSRDPLKDAEMSQGPNLYCYVGNEPIDRIDPIGLKCDCTDSSGNPTQGNVAAAKCCTGAPPISNSGPNPYPSNYTYAHRSARLFFQDTRNGAWSDSVRGCLVCMFKHGASPTFAHFVCYAAEGAKHPISVWGDLGDAIGTYFILPSQ
jgi:RHS repeat-associated protein